MLPKTRRVVVTGIGAVSPLGATANSTWRNLIAGKSGIRKIPQSWFATDDLQTKIAGIIPPANEPDGLDLDSFVPPKEQRKMDRFIQLGLVAAQQAVEDSGWVVASEENAQRTGVLLGSGIGGLATIAENAYILKEKGARRISPFFIPASLINLLSGHVAIKFGYKGPNHSVVTACATGTHAIGDASKLIAHNYADVMVAGGAESAICALGIAGFNACRALSTSFNDEPHRASRPWDKARDGFVMGEGAAVLILEEYEHAVKRGAKIYAEVAGYGLSGDAYHITAPSEDGDGGYRAMQAALKSAGVTPEQIDYINAHGTSTPPGDLIELNAVKRLLNGAKTSMSSTKSSVGHLLGAAGSIEAVFSILAIRDNVMPATLNLENPDDGCEGIDLVPNKPKEKKLDTVLSNSFGFGGTNASLVFKRVFVA